MWIDNNKKNIISLMTTFLSLKKRGISPPQYDIVAHLGHSARDLAVEFQPNLSYLIAACPAARYATGTNGNTILPTLVFRVEKRKSRIPTVSRLDRANMRKQLV